MPNLDRRTLDYHPFYCEENVWRLLGRAELAGHRAWAVIVASRTGRLVALRQKAGRGAAGLICWDYHVFAAVDGSRGTRLALDLDSRLPFPCPLAGYLEESFPPMAGTTAQPCFRVLTSADYAAHLATDRSHMRNPDGSYLMPPPPWPAPGGGRRNTFLSWLDLSAQQPGELLDLAAMAAFAAGKP